MTWKVRNDTLVSEIHRFHYIATFADLYGGLNLSRSFRHLRVLAAGMGQALGTND